MGQLHARDERAGGMRTRLVCIVDVHVGVVGTMGVCCGHVLECIDFFLTIRQEFRKHDHITILHNLYIITLIVTKKN